jgi:molybdopterin synthase catalytic subunit
VTAAAREEPRAFSVRTVPLSVDECVAHVQHEGAGGIDVFVGVVRNVSEGRAVTLLEYEAYPSMAEKEMERIAAEIAAEEPGVRLAVHHRVGPLRVGEAAVVCAASAPHRGEAFRACRLLIDRIKERVPIWKREHGPDGAHWVGWQDARCVAGDAAPGGHEAHRHG